MKEHPTRKAQIEQGFLSRLMRDLKDMGYPINSKARTRINEALRSAAMVGACEERSRTLSLMKSAHDLAEMPTRITAKSVLDVLGYDDEQRKQK